LNYYPFHIGDFRSGTVNMSRQARWIYRDMMDVYYDVEAPLPLDIDVLCDALGVEAADERAIVERLLRFKFLKTDAGYRHDVCEQVIADYQVKAETAKANGKLGGRPRKQTATNQEPSGFPSGSDSDATGNPAETGSKTNQEPITNNHKPVKTKDKSPPAPDALFPDVDPQIVADFKALRTKHKAPITRTAIQGIVREAEKAGLTLEGALRICCERGWRGLKAEWITQHAVRAGSGQGTSTVYDQTMAAAERAKARIFGSTAQQGEKYDAG